MSQQTPAPKRRVYTVTGVPPEIQAYAMAKYSRSAQSMIDSIQELSAQRAERFLDTFYFQYGHRSIADLAHLHFAVEQISILAAVRLVDEPLWDGQERSTRYQPFRKTGYYVPPEIIGTELETTYRAAADRLFDAYDAVSKRLTAFLVEAIPAPADADPKAHERTLRARAFDVARGLLPLATHTSVGQVVSARVLERQICRLLADRYPEVRALGEDLKAACQAPSEDPLRARLRAFAETLDAEARAALEQLLETGPIAPTLVKYTAPDRYPTRVYQRVAAIVQPLLPFAIATPWAATPAAQPPAAGAAPRSARGMGEVLLVAGAIDPVDEIVATLVFRIAAGVAYPEVLAAVQALPASVKQEVLAAATEERGPHDEHLRELRSGYSLAFDLLMDYGSFRDLHRHRRCIQIAQELTAGHGFDPAETVFPLAFGAELGERLLASGVGADYERRLAEAGETVDAVAREAPDVAPYLLPLAYRQRALFKLDDAEAAYIIEQRTAPAGHFSYRSVAYQMWQELQAHRPAIAALTRVTNPHEVFDLLTR